MNALRYLTLMLATYLVVLLARAEDAVDLLDQPPSFDADTTTDFVPAEPLKPLPENKPLVSKPVAKKLDQSLGKFLDLTVPFKTGDMVTLPVDEMILPVPLTTTIFTPADPAKTQKIRLEGNIIMTHEQEVEKRKSFDGAGISINLKP